MQFTQEDLQNIFALISIAPITGKEAETVALLKQKIKVLLDSKEEKKDGAK